VLPDYIGNGFGKFLLHESLTQAITITKEIHVIADPNSEAFYASQGFETFDKTESFPKGRFLPVMKKSGHL
jgi:N-acetylglutamate synthase-like GNAT family acetyltransferase